jgi:hypothetical protein
MQKPCRDCPFREGSPFIKSLEPARKREIAHSIIEEDKPFLCHKTTRLPASQQRICVGSAIAAGDRVFDNCAYRIHAMYGRLHMDNVDRSGILTLEEWLTQR